MRPVKSGGLGSDEEKGEEMKYQKQQVVVGVEFEMFQINKLDVVNQVYLYIYTYSLI